MSVAESVLSLLLVLVPLIAPPVHFSLYVVHKSFAVGLLTTAAVVALFVKTWRGSRTRFPVALLLLIYLGSAAVSLVQAVNPYEAVARLLSAATGVALFWVTVNAVTTPAGASRLLSWAAVSGVLVSLVGAYQFWVGGIPGLDELLPPASTFGNKALAAQFLVLVFPLPFLFLFVQRAWWRELVWGAGGGMIVAYLVYTRSRGGWVAAVAAVLLVLVALRAAAVVRGQPTDLGMLLELSRRRKTILAGVGVGVLVATVGPAYLGVGRVAEPLEREILSFVQPREYTTGLRVAWWANTIPMIRDHPVLGVGLGNWPLVYPRYARSVVADRGFSLETQPNEAHNDYLQALAETGPSGLLAFLWVLVCLGRRAWQGFVTAQDRGHRLMIVAVTIGLVAVLGHAFVDFPFGQPVPTAFFWIFAGIVWAVASAASADSRDRRLPRLVAWGALAIVVASHTVVSLARVRADYHFALAAGYAWSSEDKTPLDARVVLGQVKTAIARYPFEYNYHVGEAILGLRTGAYPEALDASRRALRLHPYYVPAYINLGLAYMGLREAAPAEAAFNEALRISPDSVEPHNNLGILYATMGRRADAEREFRTALRLSPENSWARRNLQLLLGEEAEK